MNICSQLEPNQDGGLFLLFCASFTPSLPPLCMYVCDMCEIDGTRVIACVLSEDNFMEPFLSVCRWILRVDLGHQTYVANAFTSDPSQQPSFLLSPSKYRIWMYT